MNERKGATTFQGNPLTLVGPELQPGDDAPDVSLLTTALEPFQLGSLKGKVTILSAVPSLDTGVCSLETKRFNDEIAKLPGVAMVTVSMDLPFAIARWATENQVENVMLLSDHKSAAFGEAYGVLIQELRLLARCVFVVDKAGDVQYVQLVQEMTDEPNYDDVLAAARHLV